MKIAFTSCMSTTVFRDQPVWDQIRAQQPDRLVLTGDSIYIDAPPYAVHPKQMSDNDFAQHVFGRWRDLLAQPQFAALVRAVPTDAIWDDHDFLWNEHYEERAIRRKVYRGLIRASRALFNAYCRALDARLAPGSFPAAYNDASLWQPDEPPPGYKFRDLGQGIVLHLTDGRSERVDRTLLGARQRDQIAAQMAARPSDTVHLLASGSVVEANCGDQWGTFDDHAWLLDLARHYKIMVLSGDIHDNVFDAIDVGNGRYLFDATASGAAIRRLMTLLSPLQNYGLLDIDDHELRVSLYSFGQLSYGPPVRIDRQRWQLIP